MQACQWPYIEGGGRTGVLCLTPFRIKKVDFKKIKKIKYCPITGSYYNGQPLSEIMPKTISESLNFGSALYIFTALVSNPVSSPIF